MILLPAAASGSGAAPTASWPKAAEAGSAMAGFADELATLTATVPPAPAGGQAAAEERGDRLLSPAKDDTLPAGAEAPAAAAGPAPWPLPADGAAVAAPVRSPPGIVLSLLPVRTDGAPAEADRRDAIPCAGLARVPQGHARRAAPGADAAPDAGSPLPAAPGSGPVADPGDPPSPPTAARSGAPAASAAGFAAFAVSAEAVAATVSPARGAAGSAGPVGDAASPADPAPGAAGTNAAARPSAGSPIGVTAVASWHPAAAVRAAVLPSGSAGPEGVPPGDNPSGAVVPGNAAPRCALPGQVPPGDARPGDAPTVVAGAADDRPPRSSPQTPAATDLSALRRPGPAAPALQTIAAAAPRPEATSSPDGTTARGAPLLTGRPPQRPADGVSPAILAWSGQPAPPARPPVPDAIALPMTAEGGPALLAAAAAPAGVSAAVVAPPAAPASGHALPAPVAVAALPAIAMAVAADAGSGQVALQLAPPELGRVRMHIRCAGEDLRVLVLVERPDTLDLLRRNAAALLSELADAGFTRPSLDFARDGAAGHDRPSGDEAASLRIPADGSDGVHGPAPPPPAAWSPAAGRLDIRL